MRRLDRLGVDVMVTSADLRQQALVLHAGGELSPTKLVDAAQDRVELLYDLVEMPYGTDCIAAVDEIRSAAMAAADLILEARRPTGES